MRELSSSEIAGVAGGDLWRGNGFEEDPLVMPPVVVTGQRIRENYTFRGNLNGWDVYQNGDQVYLLQGGGGGGAVVPAEDAPPMDSTVQTLLDELTGDAVTSGQEAADIVNDLTGNTGDNVFREWLCDVFMQNEEICELYVQP